MAPEHSAASSHPAKLPDRSSSASRKDRADQSRRRAFAAARQRLDHLGLMPRGGRIGKDYTGVLFGRLTALEEVERRAELRRYRCRCVCGTEVVAVLKKLQSGHVRSCGCLVKDTFTTHGMTESPEYNCWQMMLRRCRDPNRHEYARYGGRGITVADEWLRFERFYAYKGPSPSHVHSITR